MLAVNGAQQERAELFRAAKFEKLAGVGQFGRPNPAPAGSWYETNPQLWQRTCGVWRCKNS